ncbi:MAG: hypothetical protein GWO24_32165, partial [Akkermansiaceae bacterium]|nr:hypothetical protein [Akkermansiaceae bacterium]
MSRRRRARRKRGEPRRGGVARWLGRTVVLVLVLGMVGILGGYFWLQNYLRSEGFREMVNRRVGEKLEAEARFNKFDWDGLELRAPLFIARGEKRIRRVDMEGLETEVKLTPLLVRKVDTQEIRARRLAVEVDVTQDAPPLEQSGRQSFAFSRARIDELAGMVDWGTTALKWEGIKTVLTPGHSRGSYDAALSRGRLLTPLSLFPELRLREASLRYAGRALFVRNGD